MTRSPKSRGKNEHPGSKSNPENGSHNASKKEDKRVEALEEAELCQWLEFAADVANRKNLTDDQLMIYLRFLDNALATRAFVTGPRSTTADTTLYAALRDVVSKLSFPDKERVPRVGRWFSHLQSLKGPKSAGVIFSLTPLY
ncbi:uncharacterized protein LOC100903294 [Galendromus occidentalis]|uniref:Uncharacterized protein LOC100903294 n=1 Tax=Galendromus occidentalis TaxID=34638 RepID=A0AAJ6QLT9_9ACAR|nr:uncharacterized protein LOC100903294 [Galendromus occidentalis]